MERACRIVFTPRLGRRGIAVLRYWMLRNAPTPQHAQHRNTLPTCYHGGRCVAPHRRVLGCAPSVCGGLQGVAALFVVLSRMCSVADPTVLTAKPSGAPAWLQSAMAPLAQLAPRGRRLHRDLRLLPSALPLRAARREDRKPQAILHAPGPIILPAYYAWLALSIVVVLTAHPAVPGSHAVRPVPPPHARERGGARLPRPQPAVDVQDQRRALEHRRRGAALPAVPPARRHPVPLWAQGALLSCGTVAALVLAFVPKAPKLYPGICSSRSGWPPRTSPTDRCAGAFVGWTYRVAFLSLVAWALLTRAGATLAEKDVPFGLATACVCAREHRRPARAAGPCCRGVRWCRWARFSYSLALMHHPIQQILYAVKPAWVQREGPVLTYLLVVGLPIILLGSRLFAHLFERPFLAGGIPSRAPRATDPWVPTCLPLATTSGKATAPAKRPSAAIRARVSRPP